MKQLKAVELVPNRLYIIVCWFYIDLTIYLVNLFNLP